MTNCTHEETLEICGRDDEDLAAYKPLFILCGSCGEKWPVTTIALVEENALQRKQLRNAWAKLGCRCIFDDEDRKTHEDDHCPYHGVYQRDPDGWDPLGVLGEA